MTPHADEGGSVTPPIPDYPGPLIGYRTLTVDADNVLRSPFRRDHVWLPDRVEVASCPAGHRAPAADCRCGLYARLTVEALLARAWLPAWGSMVIARVEAWGDGPGDVQLGPLGVRAQRMRIVGVVDLTLTSANRARVAEAFGVPLEPYEGLLVGDLDDANEPLWPNVDPTAVTVTLRAAATGYSHVHWAPNPESWPGRAVDVAYPRPTALEALAAHVRDRFGRLGERVRDALGLPDGGACTVADCPSVQQPGRHTCRRHAHTTDAPRPPHQRRR